MAAEQCVIVGPASLVVRLTSPWGPFARKAATLRMRGQRFSIVNAGTEPCTLSPPAVGPVTLTQSGTTAEAELSVAAEPGGATLAPGASRHFVLAGAAPATPGAYATALRLAPDHGPPLAIPVSLNVAASAGWGILCMVCGLLVLGVINVLAGENVVKTRLRDALQARQDIHVLLEAHPAPESKAGDVDGMDHDFDAAIIVLGERRKLSILDHRKEEASRHLADALAASEELRKLFAGAPRGAAEIDDLQHELDGIKPLLQEIAELPGPQAGTTAPADLSGKLDAFLIRYRQRMVRAPAAFLKAETNAELGRMQLDEAAAEGDAARDLAINTRLWLRRSAADLDRALRGYREMLVEAGWMLNTDRTMRDRAAHDDLAPGAAQKILAALDRAGALMDGTPSLDDFRQAHARLDDAWTEQVRGVTEMAKQRVAETIARTDQATDWSDVQKLTEQLQAMPPPHTPAMKQQGLMRILDLWQVHADDVTQPEARQSFSRQIAALRADVAAGRLLAVGQPYRTLLNDWTAWQTRQERDALDRLDHPRCLEYYADLQRNAAGIEASLRARPPGEDLQDWDRQLDQIRLDMQRHGPDAATVSTDCMAPLLQIGDHVSKLSGMILAATIADVPLPSATRIMLAGASGLQAAMDAVQFNMDHARILKISPLTPEAERVAGRAVTFTIGNMDPVWRASTTIRVDFDTAGPSFEASAEELDHGKQITHAYPVAATAHLRVTATALPKPGETKGELLGEGHATVLIAPSPVGAAQDLADAFFNLRFGLALLIASTVYYWRYQSRPTVFGARGFDYVEAFALGFAADAAVSNLPKFVAGIAPVGG